MKESDLLLKNSHQLENGLQSYHGEQKRGYHLNHLSIKNYIRNWCQKWCCILFGAIYRENKQWSPRYHFIYYYFLMSLVARGFLLQNHISSSILRIMGSSSLRDCFSVFPLQMAWLDLANIVSYSNESVSFKWELPIMPLSFHQKWGAIERGWGQVGNSHLNEKLSFE